MLEANNLMDKDKLNFLIALSNKEPEAIKKLVAESGIDAFDVDSQDVNKEYTPQDYSISDSEFAVQQAFDAIASTSSYDDTLKTIAGFDDTSKTEIRENPVLIGQLSQHHEDGTYSQIQAIVAKERLIGNLPGLSDFAAYKHVWNTVQENLAGMGGSPEAGHKNLTNDQKSKEDLAGTEGTQEAGHNTNTGTQVGTTQAKARKAAEATNTSRGSRKSEPINFDTLTDEEFNKLELADIL